MNSEIEAAALERQGRKQGREIVFLCPSHDARHPTASYNVERQVWQCFSCGARGGYVDLARRLGVSLPRRDRKGPPPPKRTASGWQRCPDCHHLMLPPDPELGATAWWCDTCTQHVLRRDAVSDWYEVPEIPKDLFEQPVPIRGLPI